MQNNREATHRGGGILLRNKNILLLILFIAIPTNLYAKMYKWVDKNGKVSYTNIAPPPTAKQVSTSREFIENPIDKENRLRKEQIQRENKLRQEQVQKEEAAKLKKYQQVQERILREQRKMQREEQRLIAKQNLMAHKNNLESAYTLELNRLKSKQKWEEKLCRKSGTSSCFSYTRKRYRKKIQALKENPQQYFYNQTQSNSQPNNEIQDPAIINGVWDTESQEHTIINGEWDSQGRHYTPAGGGNAWRSDGTFMQKAGGGYIDTQTGQFVPAN